MILTVNTGSSSLKFRLYGIGPSRTLTVMIKGRGIYFPFISAKAMATMEFLQQEWINDGNFMGLGKERGPNVGRQEEGATFTIPKDPVRRRVHGIEHTMSFAAASTSSCRACQH